MLFYTIYTNYDYKPLNKVRKLAISQNKLKELVLKKNLKVALKKLRKKIQYQYIYLLKQKN